MHPAFRGLFDYDALKARSNDHYDQADQDLRAEDGYGGYNNTMNLMHNQASKISPWAPYLQSLQENGVNRVGMDAGRPHGIADQPGFAEQGNLGGGYQVPHQPLMDSTNIAGEQPVNQRSLALNGLQSSLAPLPPGHDQFMAGLHQRLGPRPATPLTYQK